MCQLTMHLLNSQFMKWKDISELTAHELRCPGVTLITQPSNYQAAVFFLEMFSHFWAGSVPGYSVLSGDKGKSSRTENHKHWLISWVSLDIRFRHLGSKNMDSMSELQGAGGSCSSHTYTSKPQPECLCFYLCDTGIFEERKGKSFNSLFFDKYPLHSYYVTNCLGSRGSYSDDISFPGGA